MLDRETEWRETDVTARVCVLERRMDDHEREQGKDDGMQDARLQALEEKFAALRTDFEVLKSQVAMYAGLGAALGGVAVNVLASVIPQWVR